LIAAVVVASVPLEMAWLCRIQLMAAAMLTSVLVERKLVWKSKELHLLLLLRVLRPSNRPLPAHHAKLHECIPDWGGRDVNQ